jgi:DNA-binding transcriptional LysR family regulator
MDLHHLREFAAIAESRSFSKAARQLNVAQPPLSRHIHQLEEELGVQLFMRTATGVELTREGTLLLEQAHIVLADTAVFFDLARRAKAGLANTLRVAMAPGLCEVVNRIRILLNERIPELTLEGTDIASFGQYDALRHRLVDLGVLRQLPEDPEIESESLFAERFVVMVSENSPLAKRKSVRLKELAGMRLLLQDRDWAALAHARIRALYAAAGVTPDLVTLQATPGNQASMLAVAAGEAICLGLQGAFSRSYLPVSGVAVIPLDEPETEIQIQIAWRKGETSPMVCEFLRGARELYPHKRDDARRRTFRQTPDLKVRPASS